MGIHVDGYALPTGDGTLRRPGAGTSRPRVQFTAKDAGTRRPRPAAWSVVRVLVIRLTC
jgi:hypothetical protein